MKVTVHRGAAEIGGTCIEIEENGKRLIVDLGLPLDSAEDQIENIFPDVKGLFHKTEETSSILGVLISHPHQDHYGLISHIVPEIPVYSTAAGRVLMEMGELLSECKTVGTWKSFKPFEKFVIGEFSIQPYLVDHSAFDACLFLIEGLQKKLFYSGDFRAHGRKSVLFENFIKHPPTGIDALLMEGTMLGRTSETVQTESDLEDVFAGVIQKSAGLTICTMSSQNIDRIVSIYRATVKSGRTLVVDLFTAIVLDRLKGFAKIPHLSDSFPRIKIWYPYFLAKRIAEVSGPEILYPYRKWKISKEEISEAPEKYVLLAKASYRLDIEKMDFKNGDYIYSQWKGYFKDPKQEKLNDLLKERNVQFHHIHTSGHAVVEDLKLFVESLKPNTLIPIHTEHPEEYSAFSDNVTLIEDGVPFKI